MTSTRPREGRSVRNAVGGEHDRLKRAVLQPVQCWDKKWTESKNGKGLQVFKWVKCFFIFSSSIADRQVDFDEEDDDDEIEQIPAPRPAEEIEEVGTPAPALPTLQDVDDTTVSTPAQTGEEDEEDEPEGPIKPPPSHPLSQSYSEPDRRPSTSSHPGETNAPSKSTARDDNMIRVMPVGSGVIGSRGRAHNVVDDEEDDTDSSRPLVFTPSLETPVDTQANTPQDFESMSPTPVEADEYKRDAQVELVVKSLDEGQAEMEEEMEEEEVEKEKEYEHGFPLSATETIKDEAQSMEVENAGARLDPEARAVPSVPIRKAGDDSSMDIDSSTHSSSV
ncbi:hypothetical protein BX616_005200 [Lobosporangium transversale]|uniref:Uncharacterized protein n=1 Tax=Lobosporangium transversale TaxID=64571 RepID=A0A1Y2GVX0_9FUNG|nr:hypothetical protein BCR41DRAFT_348326 [Lobosporangium transversale]KAF9897653.1 hypothetical protein BX616_005200 [Lobosporangium transversale]ORZ26446.1 hypothetical protein BCR41DRAFT_348326 [Lobosporangium transversale]|eukprot:XP_021884211.1 hypothetical protein BCR41DRAFT_348326 [Lobosporangium transversale]